MGNPLPIPSMGLVYSPTWMVDFYGKCRQIYQSHGSYGLYGALYITWVFMGYTPHRIPREDKKYHGKLSLLGFFVPSKNFPGSKTLLRDTGVLNNHFIRPSIFWGFEVALEVRCPQIPIAYRVSYIPGGDRRISAINSIDAWFLHKYHYYTPEIFSELVPEKWGNWKTFFNFPLRGLS